MISLRYEVKSGRQSAADEFTAGSLSGNAPMFERFVLGNSSTLRGWNRYAIDPLGADRIVHNSLTYGYQLGERTVEVFYDCGMLWNTGNSTNSARAAQPRHSLGVGYKQGVFILALAFPVIEGKVAPVLMAGMNY
jgi:outer membrane protein assembly factor BamA